MVNDNILDVLTYMFDYLFDEANDNRKQTIDNISLKKHLTQAGFDQQKIDKALDWLEDIAQLQDDKITTINTQGGLRIYTGDEQRKLGKQVIALLTFMEQSDQLDIAEREAVIEQVMRLEQNEISLDDFKWVLVMALGNRRQAAFFEALTLDIDEHTLQ